MYAGCVQWRFARIVTRCYQHPLGSRCYPTTRKSRTCVIPTRWPPLSSWIEAPNRVPNATCAFSRRRDVTRCSVSVVIRHFLGERVRSSWVSFTTRTIFRPCARAIYRIQDIDKTTADVDRCQVTTRFAPSREASYRYWIAN